MTFWFESLFPGNLLGDTLFEAMVYLAVTNVFELGMVVLAPLWVGLMMKIKTKMKLLLIPLVPYLAALVFEVISTVNGIETFVIPFWAPILFILTLVTQLSAFVAWIVAWVICSLDRNYYDSKEPDVA